MADPLNRTSAKQIVRFFDLCFKQGVIDAYNFADDYGSKEFLDKHTESWDFGVLGEPDDFDWEMWRFTLYRWARHNHMMMFSENYIFSIVRKNYLWYLLPFCMRFYLLGISEWLEYPNPVGIALFKQNGRVHWSPQKNSSLQRITVNDFISYMQQFVYEYRRTPDETKTMNPGTMDGYCQAIHDLTRRYDTGRSIRIEEG